ncbi:MAG: hypothetical protein Q9157_002771 [Trypethelium eluteriae]
MSIFDLDEISVVGDSHIMLSATRNSALYSKIQKGLGQKYLVPFHGFRGKNVGGICTILRHILEPKRNLTSLEMIVAGTNSDCRDKRWESDEVIRSNLRDALENIAKEYPSCFILLNTPPPIQNDREYKKFTENGQEMKKIWREQKRIAEIASVIREFKGLNVGICDLYKALSEKKGNWHTDGIHLSIEAEEIWASLAIEELEANGIRE